MNVDKKLIKHWAFLFESEDARKSGDMSYLEEGDGFCKKKITPQGDIYNHISEHSYIFRINASDDTDVPSRIMVIFNMAKDIILKNAKKAGVDIDEDDIVFNRGCVNLRL